MSALRRTSILQSAALTVGMRWIDRLIGLVSTLILARLLVPADFGIIAMASLVVGLFEVILDLGVNVALIQNANAGQAHYDTAWTLRLLQTLVTAGAIALGAPLAGEYFGDPRVVAVLQFMALGPVLTATENIGVVTFQKNMQFGLDFRFMFLKRFAGFLATMLAAVALESYWALVIGALSGKAVGVVLSYLMHPMRPRLSLSCHKDIFSVSQWMLVRSIGAYFNGSMHRLLVGNQADAPTMGAYSLASEISSMPAGEVLSPINRVLFPAFVRAKHDLAELKRLYLLSLGVQSLLAIPASVGLALLAHEAVLVLLGEKWLLAVPFVQLLALSNVVQAISTSGGYVMISLGQVRKNALLVWVQVIIFAALAFVALPDVTPVEIARLRLTTVFLGLTLSLALLMSTLHNVKLTHILAEVYRPILGATLMAAALLQIDDFLSAPPLGLLLIKMSTGAVIYVVSVVIFWYVVRQPFGAETYILGKVKQLRNRARGIASA